MSDRSGGRVGTLLRFFVGCAIVAGGLYLSYDWLNHRPKAHKKSGRHAPKGPLVEVVRPTPADARIRIETYGVVIPYRQQILSSRVSSQVVRLSDRLIPGGLVKRGELLVELDRSDYLLALSERSAAVADARLALRSEMENGKSALFEYRLSGQKLPEKEREFLLRKPHIEAARSALKAAEAAYEKAKRDLERCRIRAPFDAVVTRVDTAVGDVVGTSKALATLVRSDRFLVRAVLSPRLLEGIEIPGYNASRGSKATLRHDYWPLATPPRQGSVTGVEWGVDEESKMAYLLVEVDDPLLLENRSKRLRPLLLNGYVRLTLSGRWMKGVLKLPLTVLRGDGEIWTVSKKGRLHIRKVTVLWRDDRDLYLPADVLAEGESVVLTRIETPVEGMRLRIRPLQEHSGAAESGSGPRHSGRKEPR